MKPISTVLTFIGGAGVASLVGILTVAVNTHLNRKQHQKDVTMTEIWNLIGMLNAYDTEFQKNINNEDKLLDIKIKILLCLSVWSTNIMSYRISQQMAKYALTHTLTQVYSILSDDLPIFLSEKEYHSTAQKVIRLFKACDIIK